MRIVPIAAAAALLTGCMATKIVTIPVRVAAKTVGVVAKAVN